MAKMFTEISETLQDFIKVQPVFFVGTAAADGRVNISPKGMDSLRVINEKKIMWLNLTGSGNETAAHLLKNDRMTIMFCSFEKKPLILRLYGQAKIYHHSDQAYKDYLPLFPEIFGARQVIALDIESVQTSCGYAVPFMDLVAERTQLKSWAEKQGEERLNAYWELKNTKSIDGFETEIKKNLK